MKYVYGTGFALLIGFLVFLILDAFITPLAALIVSIIVALVCIMPGARLMEGETVRESLLGKGKDE